MKKFKRQQSNDAAASDVSTGEMKVEEIHQLAKVLCEEINRHQHLDAGQKVGAAMMLICDIMASVDCPDCRAKFTAMVEAMLPALLEAAEKEHTTVVSQLKHHVH